MKAEIICIGTEILLGDIINTNAQYLAKQLANLGIEVHYQTVVGDNANRVCKALNTAYTRAELVVISGGLGPTKDDLTKEMIAEYFGKKLVFDEKAYKNVEKRVYGFGLPTVTESLRKQAYVPENSIILYNDHGTAPGCILSDQDRCAILLPGPPKEMKPMFDTCRQLFLKKISNKVIISVNLKLKAPGEAPPEEVGEAPVADKLSALLDLANPTVATYAKDDGCLIRITASAQTREEALVLIDPILQKIKTLLPHSINTITES